MRIAFLLFGAGWSFACSAQTNLASQIREIIQDTSGHFMKFKRGFIKMSGNDSDYQSSITIEGTKNNAVSNSRESGDIYYAVINEAIKENKGKKVIAEWKDRLAAILGPAFRVEKIEIKPWNPSKAGWNFIYGGLVISIHLYPELSDQSLYWAGLFFTYYPS